MPTYEYECRKCGHQFEKFASMSAPREKKCPECGGRVEQLISTGGGIIVRGGAGFKPECGRNVACPSCPATRDTPPCAR